MYSTYEYFVDTAAFSAEIHPFCRAAGYGDDTETDIGIGFTGLRIAFRFQHAARTGKRNLGADRLAGRTELEVGDRVAVGRPPVRGV